MTYQLGLQNFSVLIGILRNLDNLEGNLNHGSWEISDRNELPERAL